MWATNAYCMGRALDQNTFELDLETNYVAPPHLLEIASQGQANLITGYLKTQKPLLNSMYINNLLRVKSIWMPHEVLSKHQTTC